MADKKSKDVKKYLTEIKELPSYEDGKRQPDDSTGDKLEKSKQQKTDKETEDQKSDQQPQAEAKGIKSETVEVKTDHGLPDDVLAPKQKDVKRVAGVPLSTRDIILNVINLLTLILLIVLITRIDDKAAELKQIKNENIRLSQNYNYNSEQVDSDLEKAQELRDLFVTQSGVIDFVSDVEGLKNESEAVRKVSFSSPDPVQDRSGSYGRPIVVALRGDWEQIAQAIQNIESLPYLFRPVKIEILTPEAETREESSDEIEVSYGGLLYVKDPNDAESE